MRGITKRFDSVVACDGVDLSIERGEVHGLLGQNGAGKSTLMKILLGLHQPDAGRILFDGTAVSVADPSAAAALGVAMVHQHLSVIGPLTVWENVTLGERGRIDRADVIRSVDEIGERFGLRVDPRARVDSLSLADRQRVEIIKCLRRTPRVLIFDEPTSVLTVAESRELFGVLRRVVDDERCAVILISHKLDEILHATDRVTIMRKGRIVASHETGRTDAARLARDMVGREVSLRSDTAAAVGALTEPAGGADDHRPHTTPVVLRIDRATARAPDGRRLLDECTLDVGAGEIVGLAGADGSGQAALEAVLSGLLALDDGLIEVDGRRVATGHVGAMARAGVAVIPEDRHAAGCVLDLSVAENLVLGGLASVSRRGFLERRAVRQRAVDLIERYGISTPSPDTPLRQLSGGNQQRVVLARELSRRPSVLVAAQPTRGLDVGAIEYVNAQLRRAADDGVAVLLVSSELEEILALSDRVAVIASGRIMGVLDRAEADVERVGLLLGGHAA